MKEKGNVSRGKGWARSTINWTHSSFRVELLHRHDVYQVVVLDFTWYLVSNDNLSNAGYGRLVRSLRMHPGRRDERR